MMAQYHAMYGYPVSCGMTAGGRLQPGHPQMGQWQAGAQGR